MREVINLNDQWRFSKEANDVPTDFPENWESVNLPHCWNAKDGQDGGNDYYRGKCYYTKKFESPAADRVYLEICGANSSAQVFMNGKLLGSHDGGYSTWRVELTEHLQWENLLTVAVDNSPNDHVYPQMADFTFYGGLYRNVNLICVSESHFDLGYYGSTGIKVTPDGDRAEIETFIKNKKEGQQIRYTVLDAELIPVAQIVTDELNAVLQVSNVHLWHGKKDPYLYMASAELMEKDQVLDHVAVRFGFRTFEIHPEKGFLLNGEEYPLRGVSRHQDRGGIGNALLPEHHEEDMDLICELGATTVRLAHYQHDQYFYDLCDQRGLIVWAEIPYISNHLSAGRQNTVAQMTELIVQNYHHPSIVVWGLSNEITMGGDADEALMENHKVLNDLAHDLDKTRLTTLAALTMCSIDSPYLQIPDVVSYNHYFGWYGGETSMNGPWFDKFHAKYPNIPIGCSEYGCEALDWHTSEPSQGDYTEEYQAYYHEELIKQLFPRKYLWATHVWNMFDFGADARNEGGENGQNHKGLVTIDRKYKKDAFYAYKAWLSDEPFVHICGKRYVDRVEKVTKVTVYSNQPEVELFANEKSLGKKSAADHFFYFDVPNEGETTIVAAAGNYHDVSHIRKVEVFNEDYRMKEKGAVLNWFDITAPKGRLSLNDKLSDIMATIRGKLLIMKLAKKAKSKMEKTDKAGFEVSKDLIEMMSSLTLIRLAGLMGTVGISFTKEELLDINTELNKIKKKK